LNSANTKKTNACKRWREHTWRWRETKKLQQHWKRGGCLVFVRLFQTFFLLFFICVYFLLFPSSVSSSLSRLVPALSSPLFWRFYLLKQMEQRLKVSSCSYLVSPLFFSSFIFSSFSSTACLPDLIATQGWRKKLPLFSVFFLS